MQDNDNIKFKIAIALKTNSTNYSIQQKHHKHSKTIHILQSIY
jgi:hypothetical protein